MASLPALLPVVCFLHLAVGGPGALSVDPILTLPSKTGSRTTHTPRAWTGGVESDNVRVESLFLKHFQEKPWFDFFFLGQQEPVVVPSRVHPLVSLMSLLSGGKPRECEDEARLAARDHPGKLLWCF